MTPGRRSRGARFTPLSTPKACRYGPSFIPSASRTAPSTSSGGAALVLDKIRNRFPWLELVWADNGYNAWQVEAAVAKVPVLRLEIVKRGDDLKGFVVLPRRWVVERDFLLVRPQSSPRITKISA